MNQEIKKRWIKALRSGEYKQGQGALKSADQFCCLGVLCDLHAKETGSEWVDVSDEFWHCEYLGDEILLPDQVRNWAGLEQYDPVIDKGKTVSDTFTVPGTLTVYNDHEEYDFNQIADLIEKHL